MSINIRCTWFLQMFIYMAFPVGVFYYFNQPKFFEKWLVEVKREMYPHENQTHKKEIQDFIKQYREEKDVELLQQLENAKKNSK